MKKDKSRQENVSLNKNGQSNAGPLNGRGPADTRPLGRVKPILPRPSSDKEDPGILDWLIDAELGLWSPLLKNLGKTFINAIPPLNIEAELDKIVDEIKKIIPDYGKASPASPRGEVEENYVARREGAWNTEFRCKTMLTITSALSAIPFIGVGEALDEIWRLPSLEAAMKNAVDIFASEYELGQKPLLRRYWLRKYKPFIPPIQDLRLMAVREAFPVEPGEPQYREMEKWAVEQGMDPYWTTRYLYMGFIRMDVDFAIDNLVRGHWTPEKFQSFLRIADIHPDDREPITRVIYRPLSLREQGYGWDMGVVTREDMVRYAKMRRLSEPDSEKAADSMIAYRLHAEQEALRSLAVRLYREGLDDPEEFEANLAAAQTPEILRPYWRSRADLELELDMTADYARILRDAAIRRRITDETLARELGQLGFKQWKINQILDDVEFHRSYDAEAVRTLTPAQILRAYQRGIKPREWAEARLIREGYPDDDRAVLLELYKPGGEVAG